MSSANTQSILIVGTIFDGFDFIGPFATFDDAEEYATRVYVWTDEWRIAQLETPQQAQSMDSNYSEETTNG